MEISLCMGELGKMLEFVKKYGWNRFSQNCEDGLIQEIISRINLKRGVAVEFGAADGFFCSNTAALREIGWKVYMYDLDNQGNNRVEKKAITESNVNELPACDILSIDIDGNDYFVWQAYDGEPAVVIIEINSSIPPDQNHVSMERGSSYSAMLLLALSKGYFLLCHTGNMIFIKDEYKSHFPEVEGNGTNHELYFNRSWI